MSHILLIDDDEDMLAVTGRWLEKAGFRVSRAQSGKEALSMVASDKPDLILLDYAMPEMDGPAVLKALRQEPSTKDIPVLYRTGMEESESLDMEFGPDGTVPKEGGKPQLMSAVENILK